jgi:2-polyprenyl-6-methoxyphenol hydroxylase-like FAD-dependent oxidoreductase
MSVEVVSGFRFQHGAFSTCNSDLSSIGVDLDFALQVCKGIIYDAAGTRDIEIEVKTIKKWSMHAQVAASYFDKYGRIILVGDAAHRFPPAGGFGLNTGVQDAHNLAWKLAAVLKGHCPSALLLTYDTERRPVCTETLI